MEQYFKRYFEKIKDAKVLKPHFTLIQKGNPNNDAALGHTNRHEPNVQILQKRWCHFPQVPEKAARHKHLTSPMAFRFLPNEGFPGVMPEADNHTEAQSEELYYIFEWSV